MTAMAGTGRRAHQFYGACRNVVASETTGAGNAYRESEKSMKQEFPHRLQKLRERRRMSRKALGELCGLSKDMVGQYERGEREPSVGTLIELADYFEVPVDYLLGRQNFL